MLGADCLGGDVGLSIIFVHKGYLGDVVCSALVVANCNYFERGFCFINFSCSHEKYDVLQDIIFSYNLFF